jgi:hypothetical protein
MPAQDRNPDPALPPARARVRRATVEPPDPPPETSPDDYEVGYGRPPKHTQFKPGNNANPRGRPKGSKSLSSILADELNQKVAVNIGGRSVKLPARQLAMKRLVQNLLKGDVKALQIAIKLDELQDGRERTPGESHSPQLTPLEEAVLEAFVGRTRDGDEVP